MGGSGVDPPPRKIIYFFLVCQFIDISNQIEVNGHVSNFENNFLYNRLLYNFFCSTFDTSPVDSIWLEMSINWHTKSQGPKKKCIHFSRGRINPWPAHTSRNKGSFTPYALWIVQRFLSYTVYVKFGFFVTRIPAHCYIYLKGKLIKVPYATSKLITTNRSFFQAWKRW